MALRCTDVFRHLILLVVIFSVKRPTFTSAGPAIYDIMDTNTDSTTTGVEVKMTLLTPFQKKRGFKLLHLNVNGLFGKIDQIRDTLFISIEGYRTVRKDRKTGIGGGVIVYIRDDLEWQRRFDLESDIESIVVEIFVEKSKSFIVCVMYRPPDSSLHGTKNFETCLDDFLTISSTEDKETLLLGDLNIDYNKRNDHKRLKDLFVIVGLKQLIKQFTRETESSKTIIDVIFTSHQNNVKETIVLPLGISDHDLIGVNRKINVNRYVPRRIKIGDYKNYNATRFKDDMKNSDWDSIIFKDTMNESWDAFKSRIHEIINIHVPLKEISIRGKSCPWLSGEIKTKMRERDHFLRKARKYNNSFDWESYKRIRNKVTTLIRQSKKKYHQNLFTENVNDSKTFWNEIKKVYPVKPKKGVSNVIDVDGCLISNKSRIAGCFCKFFSSIGSKLANTITSIGDRRWMYYESSKLSLNKNMSVFKFNAVTPDLLKKRLKKLKVSKGAGPDGIPPRLIKDCPDEIVLPLCYLINLSLRSHTFPSAEKVARVTPVDKSDDKSKLDNYRPISALNVFSKTIEQIVHHQLYNYLEENNLLQCQQFGFRKQRSTQQAVSLFVETIRKNADKAECTGAIYLDLRKAFDTVNHSRLLHKLQLHGIHDIELQWFEDYLFNRTQYVTYDNINSPPQQITCGVPQGSTLGPLLFLLLVNDLHQLLSKSKVLLYADDIVVYYSSKSSKEVESVLNNEVQRIADWMNENCLIINLKKGKTEFVMYGAHQNLPDIVKSVYNTVILQNLLYCYPIMLSLSRTQEDKLQYLHNRAFKICGGTHQWDSIATIKKQRAAVEVFKSINGITENHFNFEQINHTMNTRRNQSNIKLGHLRTEFARKSFGHQGGMIFNELPTCGVETIYPSTFAYSTILNLIDTRIVPMNPD
ncbi:uncharacterized protein LOC130625211 [Hydractinia symbiolongicarpus]|uniref:uncharacterized protein LOC130625211 n=1 Tax=Hydractinia symbiolongicarpus TaxID=13093 RepID=UPI00254C6367|nr:uncharacterized protein LOC130625211 [Hydractinia symbiolongicarpus]